MSKLSIVCREFRPITQNTLVGFASIRVAELHLDIKDVALHQKGESRWAQLPAKPMIDKAGAVIRDASTGKIKYVNIFEFTDRANKAHCAEFILREAAAAGIKIATDGVELILFKPREMSRESWFSFERAIIALREEIIALIEQENATHGVRVVKQ